MIIAMVGVDTCRDETFKIHRPNGREDYLFVLFKSPSFVMVNGAYAKVDEGDCIIFDKHNIQSYFPESGRKFRHDFIHFNTESKAEEMLLQGILMGVPFRASSPEYISSILKVIISELNYANSKYKRDILNALVSTFIYRIKSEFERKLSGVAEHHYTDLLMIRNDIYASPEKPWTIEEVCKSVYLSRSHFQHLYKRYFSVAFVNDVINARIALAKMLLLNTELPICEIAENCGYKTSSFFIRQFKSVIGVSPYKFRSE